MSKKILLVIVLIVIVLLAGGVVGFIYFWPKGEGPEAPAPGAGAVDTQQKVAEEIGRSTEIEVGAGLTNPLKEMPVVNPPVANPMEEVANPFRESYKNPFK